MHATRGIVLNHIKYKETSVVVQIYTEAFGRQGYIVNRVRSNKNKGQTVLLQPMTLLDMEVYHRPKSSLQRIKEFKVSHPLSTIPFNQNKRAMAFFLTELMTKALREEENNSDLFNFLHHSIEVFDSGIEGDHNFHLFFMFQLTKFLGFSPGEEKPNCSVFDLLNGQFVKSEPSHGYFLNRESARLWTHLYHLRIESLNNLRLSSWQRNNLLNDLLTYYNLHLDGFGELKSLAVIRQLFHATDN